MPTLALPARPVRCIVGETTLGSSFASHISLSSAEARCHCSHFSHFSHWADLLTTTYVHESNVGAAF